MTTKIYENYKEFEARPESEVDYNGVSSDFAKDYPDYKEMNETNKKCWNCINSDQCFDCIECKGCDQCINCEQCIDCTECEGCIECEDCILCIDCSDCLYLIDCTYETNCNPLSEK